VQLRGFSIYGGYDEFVQQEIREYRLKPKWLGSFHIFVKGVLVENGWEDNWDNDEGRFHPPSKRDRQK